jgi:hypothetical protein
MKLGMYFMAPEPISAVYLINPSNESVCIPSIITRHQLNKHVPMITDTHSNRNIIEQAIFCVVNVASKENVGLCIPLLLMGNGSINTFLLQQSIIGGIIFFAVCVMWKEIKQFLTELLSF